VRKIDDLVMRNVLNLVTRVNVAATPLGMALTCFTKPSMWYANYSLSNSRTE
jgi:hypothetical protein